MVALSGDLRSTPLASESFLLTALIRCGGRPRQATSHRWKITAVPDRLLQCVVMPIILGTIVLWSRGVTSNIAQPGHTPVPGNAPALLSTTIRRSRAIYPFIRFCDPS